MDKKIYLNLLYDYYGDLLTEKQKRYYTDYYFDDLSIGEISENNNISRNAVFKQIKLVEDKLIYYENKLKLLEKRQKLLEMLKAYDKTIISSIEELI